MVDTVHKPDYEVVTCLPCAGCYYVTVLANSYLYLGRVKQLEIERSTLNNRREVVYRTRQGHFTQPRFPLPLV